MTTHVTNHVDLALGRLIEYFKNKSKIASLVTALGNQAQAVEDALYSILTGSVLADAVGVQLDRIGKIVGQSRGNSADDAEYRTRIQARVLVNKSSGTPPDLYAIFSLLLPSVPLEYRPGFPAGFEFFINTPITAAYAAVYASFLSAAKAAGVGANLIWYPDVDANMLFTENACDYLSTTATPGDTALTVAFNPSDMGFPAGGGTIIIDKGQTAQETLSYSSYTSSTISLTGGTVNNVHFAGTDVRLTGTTGLGLGDSTNPSTGGELAGAIGDE